MTTNTPAHGFQRIGTGFEETLARLKAMQAAAKQHRLDVIAERGWPAGTRCITCGDTGIEFREGATGPGPDPAGRPCDCETGAAIARHRERDRRWRASVPVRLVDYRLDTSPQARLANEMRDWVASEPWRAGENAVLFGPVGSGKTGLAVGAMREAHDAGVSTGLVILSDWLIRQRPSGDGPDRDPMEDAARPDLLVIDDLGTQKNSEWVHERIYVLINRRYLDRKSTIVTTNHGDFDALRDSLGERATSRLLEQCRIFPVEGADLRTGGRS